MFERRVPGGAVVVGYVVMRLARVGAVGAGAAVAIPVAVYLLCLWLLHDRPEYRETRCFGPIAAVLVLLTPLTGHAVLLTGLVLATLVATKVMRSNARAGVPAHN